MSAQQAEDLLDRVESVMRRVKRVLYWGHTSETADFVQSLLEKWLISGEYERLIRENSPRTSLYKSAHDFVVDKLRHRSALKRKGSSTDIEDADLPSAEDLHEFIADIEALNFVKEEVARLEQGKVREDCKKLLRHPVQTAQVLRMTMEGVSNSAIADQLQISTGTVSNRLQEGSAYLAKPLLTGTIPNRS